MKKQLVFFAKAYLLSLFIVSCSNVEDGEVLDCRPSTKTVLTDSIASFTEDLEPCIDTDSTTLTPYFYDASGTNFFKMKGFKFTIKNRGCNKYLSTRGKGRKVELSDVANSEKEYFTINNSGVYKIYSCADGTPLTLGHEKNYEDRRFLMLPETDEPTYASRWYLRAANTPGYFYIQRYQMEQIPGGGLGYYSFQVDNCSTNGFGVYSGQASQEYLITPLDEFRIESIKYAPQEAHIRHIGTTSITAGYTNEKNVEVAYNFDLHKDVTELSHFEEIKNINFSISNIDSVRFQRPGVTNKDVDIIPNQNAPYDAKYQSTQQNIRTNVKAVFPVNVPARSKINVTYTWNYYEISAGYEVVISCNGVECTLTGVWKGTVYVDDIPYEDQKWEIINLDSGVAREVKMSELLNL